MASFVFNLSASYFYLFMKIFFITFLAFKEINNEGVLILAAKVVNAVSVTLFQFSSLKANEKLQSGL